MSLTLGNDLTGTVAREVDAANRKAGGLGESLTTGVNKFVEVVDGFLGSSLTDGEVVLSAIAKNTAYGTNMLGIADEYFKAVGSSLQAGLKTIAQAGPLSSDKLAVLQKNLDDKRLQVALLIKTADFDGKSVLGGGASKIDVQVGLSITDKLTLSVKDLAAGKLFRSSVTTKLNDAMTVAGSAYYANASELATDRENNVNLISAALDNAGGSGSGGAAMLDTEFETALNAVITADASVGALLDIAAPAGIAIIQAVGGVNVRTFASVTAADVAAVMGDAGARAEMMAILADNATTNIATSGDEASRVLAQDVFTNALNTVRSEQAAISNQKSNVIEAADALRATTNVTQKAADSYLKTDYVMTAQQFSETLRTLTASITALQAANKVPEAAQKLLDGIR